MKNFQPIGLYVDHLLKNAKKVKKVDGIHQLAIACGVVESQGIEFEVKVVLEPRKDRWVKDADIVEAVNINDK